jgi:hypothetical protein
MTQREKMLGALVGLLVIVVGGVVAARSVMGWFNSRQEQIISLEGEIQRKNSEIERGKRLQLRLVEYEERSLPSRDDLAHSYYRQWLTELAERAGLAGMNIKGINPRPSGDTFKTFGFTLTGRGDVKKVVRLLHDIYAVDHLHRINNVILAELPDTRDLDVKIGVDALALSTAAPDKQLTTKPGRLLASAEREHYLETIVGRNFFGPPNQPPKLSGVSDQRAIVGRTFSFTVNAEDDKLDKVTYSLEGDEPRGARIDPQSGKFDWRSESPGKFEFTVVATDDGFPPKSSRAKFAVSVGEPPPPPVVAPPPPRALGFDHAKHAYITGIVSKGGRRQLWLTVRTTGEQLRLFEGDAIDLGSVNGKLLWLTDREGEIVTQTGSIMFGLGDNLGEAQKVKTTPASTPRETGELTSG